MPRWSDEPVTLDRSDTLHSVKGKLDAVAEGWPVVILDTNCRIAENVLTYRLLARTSQQLGTPIAVVTKSPYWRKLSREHGLRAFSSVGSLGRAGRRSAISYADTFVDAILSSLNPSFSRMGWVVLVLLLLAAGVAVYTLVPVMNVTLQTPVQEIAQDVTVQVDASIGSLDVNSSLIPGRVIEYRFSVSDTVTPATEKNMGKERAKGEVAVINSNPSLVLIPAGTVLSTGDGQRFSTASAVAVGLYQQPSPVALPTGAPLAVPETPFPTMTPSNLPGTTLRVPVIAVEPGTKGNVVALAIGKFESDSFIGLTVFNEQALTGGTDVRVKIAAADDRSRLKESLFQRGQSQALSELQMRIKQSESLIPHSMQVRIEREDYDKNIDEEADKLKGTLSVVATAIGFDNSDLNTLVDRRWKSSLPKGFKAIQGALNISPPEVLQTDSQTASLKVKTSGKAERVLEANDLTQALRGLSMAEAKVKLGQLESGLKLVKLEMWPGWANKAFRVEVQTVQ